MPDESSESIELKKLEVEYYRVRLTGTAEHTIGFSRLIYMFSGGVLALMLGAAEFLKGEGQEVYRDGAILLGLVVIAVVNCGHGYFVLSQGDWQHSFDKAYEACVDASVVHRERGWFRRWLGGSKRIYAKIHFAVAILSWLCAMAMCVSILDFFGEWKLAMYWIAMAFLVVCPFVIAGFARCVEKKKDNDVSNDCAATKKKKK